MASLLQFLMYWPNSRNYRANEENWHGAVDSALEQLHDIRRDRCGSFSEHIHITFGLFARVWTCNDDKMTSVGGTQTHKWSGFSNGKVGVIGWKAR